MSSKIKKVSLLVVSVAIILMLIIALGRDVFHAFEEIYYDKQATIFTNSAVSRLTNIVNIFCGVLSLFFVPIYIVSLLDRSFKIPSTFMSLRFICTVLLSLVFLLVIFIFFPITWVSQGFSTAVNEMFLGDCLYTHLLVPILYVTSYFFLDEKHKIGKAECIVIISVMFSYILLYTFFVFVFKTWEDFYYIKETIRYITIFGVLGVVVIALPLSYLFSIFLKNLNNKSLEGNEK